MRDRFDRDTGHGRNERGWDQRYRDDRSHFSERGSPRDEHRGAGPMVDRGAAPRDHREEGRSFGGNPLPAVGSAYSYNLGGAYHLGMTRVVSPDYGRDAPWGGPYRGESHDLRESGRSALEGVGDALGAIGDRVRSALGRGPKGYKRSDARIQEDVCEMLSDRDDIDVSDVTVRVENNEVTLEGTVPQRHHKRIIELVAEGVRGVEDVHNRIRVQRAVEPTSRSTATAGTMGDAALAGTQQGTSRPTSSHAART
ncbi:BON domain-containing protein [Sorangium sp. So ce854]|uniref:BON domain-containing protein n=1 Tax=Sorangium sp. So ce854 TaxID=3133322 RepID=UPI003F62BCEF